MISGAKISGRGLLFLLRVERVDFPVKIDLKTRIYEKIAKFIKKATQI